MFLLACFAGFVMTVEYSIVGIQPLFVTMLLGVTAWAGHCLWEDPDDDGAGPPDPGPR